MALPTSSSSSSSYSTSSDSSSDTSDAPPPPSKKPRTAPTPSSNDSKKKATVAVAAAEEEEEQDTEKQPFQRVFSEEDEIVLLEGLYEYLKESGGADEGAINMVGFHAYIKGSIHTEISKAQLSDKIKRLKRRFRNNQDRVFKQDSHEKRVFELSCKIWCVKPKGSAGKHVPDQAAAAMNPPSLPNLFDAGFEDYYGGFGSHLDGIIAGCESGSTLKKKLMKLRVAHYELLIRQITLRNEKLRLIIEATK
ncbi:hypothetical protein GQ457_08G033600 [Hibiscus cannabinus]